MKATSLLPPRTVPPAPVAPTPDVAPIRPTIAPKRLQPCGRRKCNGDIETVTKTDIARMLVDAGLAPSIAAGRMVITEVCGHIVSALKSGRRVELRGFGTFRPRVMGSSGGLVRQDGSVMEAWKRRTAGFKFSRMNRDVLPVKL